MIVSNKAVAEYYRRPARSELVQKTKDSLLSKLAQLGNWGLYIGILYKSLRLFVILNICSFLLSFSLNKLLLHCLPNYIFIGFHV